MIEIIVAAVPIQRNISDCGAVLKKNEANISFKILMNNSVCVVCRVRDEDASMFACHKTINVDCYFS